MGVAITIPSIESDSTNSRAAVVTLIPGLRCLTASSLSGRWSATATSLQPVTLVKFRIRFGPQYPHPMTPILVIASCPQKNKNRHTSSKSLIVWSYAGLHVIAHDVCHIFNLPLFHFGIHG